MVTIVETKGSKITRTITKSKPIPKKRKPITLNGQSSSCLKTMKQGISVFEERIMYTTDGANKADKMRGGKLPRPCWKSFDKRHKQWKKSGHPSVRTLNDTDRCVYPCVYPLTT